MGYELDSTEVENKKLRMKNKHVEEKLIGVRDWLYQKHMKEKNVNIHLFQVHVAVRKIMQHHSLKYAREEVRYRR